MLLSELKGYSGFTALGDKLGKVHCSVMNTKTWTVENIILKKALRKPQEYKFAAIKNLEEAKKRIVLEGKGSAIGEVSLVHMPCCELMKKKVLSSDGKDAGKIYDLVIATQFSPWKIDKILIYIKPLERRLRLDASEIKSITENITLTKTYNELRGIKE
ncbi:MAG: hypothetical protein QMD21_01035 [Candidatus Thermoplasmatota archaeon]|nr:hypothetical protein [Candidatus Thermoplasmatota archaeon]